MKWSQRFTKRNCAPSGLPGPIVACRAVPGVGGGPDGDLYAGGGVVDSTGDEPVLGLPPEKGDGVNGDEKGEEAETDGANGDGSFSACVSGNPAAGTISRAKGGRPS